MPSYKSCAQTPCARCSQSACPQAARPALGRSPWRSRERGSWAKAGCWHSNERACAVWRPSGPNTWGKSTRLRRRGESWRPSMWGLGRSSGTSVAGSARSVAALLVGSVVVALYFHPGLSFRSTSMGVAISWPSWFPSCPLASEGDSRPSWQGCCQKAKLAYRYLGLLLRVKAETCGLVVGWNSLFRQILCPFKLRNTC